MTYELPEPTRYFCYDIHEGWYSTDKATFNRAYDRFAAYSETQMQAAYAQGRADTASVVLAERERCAAICDEDSKVYARLADNKLLTQAGRTLREGMSGGAINCAAAIRAQKETE